MLDLWLIRHAESIGNLDGTAADTGLSFSGRTQAQALGARLSAESFAEVLCSPLRRAQETAALALPLVPRTSVDVLRELESSRAPTFLDPTDSAVLAALLAAPLDSTESGPAFMNRVTHWLQGLPPEGTVLAITHFAVIREVLARLFGFRHAPQSIGFTAIFRVSVALTVAMLSCGMT